MTPSTKRFDAIKQFEVLANSSRKRFASKRFLPGVLWNKIYALAFGHTCYLEKSTYFLDKIIRISPQYTQSIGYNKLVQHPIVHSSRPTLKHFSPFQSPMQQTRSLFIGDNQSKVFKWSKLLISDDNFGNLNEKYKTHAAELDSACFSGSNTSAQMFS